LHFSALTLLPTDAGANITIIAGVHVGCFELFGTPEIRSIANLKGKTVGVPEFGTAAHVLLSTMASYRRWYPMSVLIKDINWITSPTVAPKNLFADGKIDRGFK
jgi:NitT/TauT family transport system substrate-binding protein